MKLVPDVIDERVRADVRGRLARRGWARWALLDRGSYEYVDAVDEPELLASIVALARDATGRDLVVADAHAVRLLPGDFVFVRHDRVHDDGPIEVVVDLSPAPVHGAEVHYRHRGQVFFVVPSRPGAAAIVERGPTVMRNQTYVSKRWKDAEIVRVFVLLCSKAS